VSTLKDAAMSVDVPAKIIPQPREITTKPRVSDQIFRGVVTTFSFSALITLALIALFLFLEGFSALRNEGFSFITSFEWNVFIDESGKEVASFGLQAMLVGTVVISFIALLIAVPLAVLTAIFLSFYAPERIKSFLITIIDLMAAFPIDPLWTLGLFRSDANG
jgi:phosphate transport system permease protein